MIPSIDLKNKPSRVVYTTKVVVVVVNHINDHNYSLLHLHFSRVNPWVVVNGGVSLLICKLHWFRSWA